MKCDFCDGETALRKVRKQHYFEGQLFVVENVPAEVCAECGERYFHARTLDAIDRFLAAEHPVKEKLNVEVVCLEP